VASAKTQQNVAQPERRDSGKTLPDTLRTAKVIVCCGAGGVGKTTTSAALALAAAKAGRRVLVLTIDPAKRLAQAMGIPENAVKPTQLSREHLDMAHVTTGTLDAWMLNPRVVFDNLVKKLAPTPEQAEKILNLRLYQALAELVAGMQEYTAAEALYDFSTSGAYDLIVLDTPPSRNALEFLEAPGKLSRFLDEKVVSAFLPSAGSTGFSFLRKATELIGSVFVRVFGESFFKELQEFLGAFSGMFSAMRAHSENVRALLKSREATFILVTSPEQAALEEARYFRSKLVEMELPFGGFILNRSWARMDGLLDPSTHKPDGDALPELRSAWAKLQLLADQERKLAARDQGLLDSLIAELGAASGFALAGPNLGEAIADVPGLTRLADALTV
jgi:anion-transporting  ArsA/GET3 family ATPase